VCGTLALLTAASTLGPPAPTPWFNEHITLNGAVTPLGVEFTVTKDYSNRSVDFTDNLIIVNSSSTPLLLEALPPPEGGYYREITSPRNLCLKAVLGRAYEWGPPVFQPDEEPSWQPVDPYEEDAPLILYITGRSLGNGNFTVLWIDLRNQFTGDRPADVETPEPQDLTLPYLYGSERMSLRLTISYSLNQAYSPYQPLSEWVCIAPVLIAAVLALVLLAILFNRFLSFLEKRAKSRASSKPTDSSHEGAA
jgi:hypothetical protein